MLACKDPMEFVHKYKSISNQKYLFLVVIPFYHNILSKLLIKLNYNVILYTFILVQLMKTVIMNLLL